MQLILQRRAATLLFPETRLTRMFTMTLGLATGFKITPYFQFVACEYSSSSVEIVYPRKMRTGSRYLRFVVGEAF